VTSKLKLTLALVVVALLVVVVVWATRPRPVLVQAFYPLNSDHKYIADYVLSLNKQYPCKVKAEVYDIQNPEDQELWKKTGLGCAGVFINGRTRHTIDRPGGKKETIDFIKRMDSFWSKADFETVLKAEMEHPSPLPPGGFETGGANAASPAGAATGESGGPPAKSKAAPDKAGPAASEAPAEKAGPKSESPTEKAAPAGKGE
jgi:hypothetical protein